MLDVVDDQKGCVVGADHADIVLGSEMAAELVGGQILTPNALRSSRMNRTSTMAYKSWVRSAWPLTGTPHSRYAQFDPPGCQTRPVSFEVRRRAGEAERA